MATFDDAVGPLLFQQPFFGQLLLKMEHVEDRNIPTLCVNRKQLRYNPDFLATMTLDEAVWCVAHEVMHQAWMHLPQIEYYCSTGIGPDGQPFDQQEFNRALDYPINDSLEVNSVGKRIDPAKFQVCWDPQRFPHTMMPVDVYCELMKDKQKKGGGKSAGQQALDEHDAEAFSTENSAITPSDIISAAESHKLVRGSYPAGLDRLLGEIKKPKVSPWRVLRNFVTSSLPGRDATSWRRLQRRQIVRGFGMPGPVQSGAGTIGIVIDMSGSIGQEMLNLFGGHMAAIIDDARPQLVKLYWTDARVHRVDDVKNGSDLRNVLSKKVPGGGGTDMPEGVRAAERDKCDGIVVLTDGYTDFCDSARPLIWAITSANITATGKGKSIHIS